ncbi:uncharacterized protein LOC143549370 [Bidens hawaiensis]|uniref:uncharacterized protein LOC143549370 n=1 Tax=Bidens hawaiensis TaxID=980011 RepID=UPI00404A7F1B
MEYMAHDEDLAASFSSKSFMEPYLDKLKIPTSPGTPTSVLPEFSSMRSGEDCSIVKAIKKLSPIDVKRLSIHMYSHVTRQVTSTVNHMEALQPPLLVLKSNEAAEDTQSTDSSNITTIVPPSPPGSDSSSRISLPPPPPPRMRTNHLGTPELPPPPPPPPLRSLIRIVIPHQPPLPPPPSQPPLTSNSFLMPLPPPPPTTPMTPRSIPPPPTPPPMTPSSMPLPPPPPPMTPSSIPPPPPPPPPMTPRSMPLPPPPPPMTPRSIPPPPPAPMPPGSIPLVPPPAPMTPRSIPQPPPAPMTPRSIPPPPPAPMPPGSIPPPPPLAPMSSGSIPPPPPPFHQGKVGAPPPPPAVGPTRSLRAKSTTKLRRSSQMGSLYRLLKGKLEGSNLDGRSLKRTNSKIGAASNGNGKQGMADALAEMTKRSSYFIQIEEDVKNYANSIKEVKAALSSFQTTDMDELIKFHKYVESHMEKLTDETQVLARFEDFPSKKLEGLRMAAALYAKLDAIATTLQNWKIESPVNQLIDKVENYFNKIKGELDTLDRTKDQELKKFKSQNIHFDFTILVRIKELMVDVSSNCMEVALKETREPKAKEHQENGLKCNSKKPGSGKTLWRAFQFAFRVYTFAGGQDDRADFLTRELAQEIQTDPHEL